MSKTEEKFDFNISSILGGFEPEGFDNGPVIKDTEELVKTSEEELEEELENVDNDSEEDDEELEETDEDTEDGSDDTTEDDLKIEYSFKGLASYLAEEGIVDFEDSDDIEDSPDLIKNVVYSTAKNMVDEYKESIPDVGKKFLKYIEDGGDPNKFINSISAPIDFENIDLENIDNQKAVLSEFLKIQGYTDEEIREELIDYEDSLLLEKKSATALNKLKTFYSKQSDKLLQEQEALKELQAKELEEYVENIRNTIKESNNLGGLNVSASDKKDFEKYLLSRGTDGLTQYERDIQENPIKTQIELAYLKYKKFDFTKVANKVKSEEAKRLKSIFKTKDMAPKGGAIRGEESKGSLDGFAALPIF